MVYAVIDTNIIVSSFITKDPSSSTRRVINNQIKSIALSLNSMALIIALLGIF